MQWGRIHAIAQQIRQGNADYVLTLLRQSSNALRAGQSLV